MPAAGLVPLREFYGSLSERVFHSTQYVRIRRSRSNTPEPDIIHEVLGHGHLLATPTFSELHRLTGEATHRLSDEENLRFLSRVFWFTVEFGVVMEDGELRAYGAGHPVLLRRDRRVPRDGAAAHRLTEMGTADYDITHYQPCSTGRNRSTRCARWGRILRHLHRRVDRRDAGPRGRIRRPSARRLERLGWRRRADRPASDEKGRVGMTSARGHARRILVLLTVIVAAALLAAPAGFARAPSIDWSACEDAEGLDCATVEVPRNYENPGGSTVDLAVVRLPAQDDEARIGSLFVNFGGPGADAVSILKAVGAEAFASLNDRFDIVGFDPRGTGESEDAIDCRANQETLGAYRQPFPTPENIDVADWIAVNRRYVNRCVRLNDCGPGHATTGNAARDMTCCGSRWAIAS